MQWVSEFTLVRTCTVFGFVAFIIDAFARRIVGWRISKSARAGFVLDALEGHARPPPHSKRSHPPSDRGVQFASIKQSESLAETINGSARPK